MSAPLALVAPQEAAEVQSAASARLSLWGDYSLGDPWFLVLVPVALLVLLWGRSRRARVRARVPVLPAAALPRTARQRFAWLAVALQAAALVLVVVALTRPLRANELFETTSEGVDIALVLDASSSMQFDDLEAGRTRLDVVKEVVGEFAARRMTDRVGAADNVALFTFARYPRLLCPFTLDVNALQGFLEDVQMVRYRPEDGTAIGRALAKAVRTLSETDARSKVVVLLTDGQNNVDDILPLEAADFAAEQGIRVHTVFAGRYVYRQDAFGRIYPTEEELDTSELREVAARTGGRFFRARDRQALEDVYAEIERLERTERTERRYTETFDLYPHLLRWALGAYLGAWLLSSTWLRRLP